MSLDVRRESFLSRTLDGLIGWSVENRLLVLLAAGAVAIAGIHAASTASLDVLPDFMPARVVVQTEAPGMGASDVEAYVTRPLEAALLGTPRAANVRSTSTAGLSVIDLFFEDGLDNFRARQLVTERLTSARARLPRLVHDPQLEPASAPIGALLKVAITWRGPDGGPAHGDAAERALRAFAQWTIKPRLSAVSGVAHVIVHGGALPRFEVRPDPAKLLARGLTPSDVAAAITASQSFEGAGFVESGDARLAVRGVARLVPETARATLESLPVGGRSVTVGEVAEVVEGEEPRIGAVIYDGHPAVYLEITKVPGADTLTVTHLVEAEMAGLAREAPEGIAFEPPVFRQATFIRTSIVAVVRSMSIGSVLVIAVLLAFLRRGRLAVISLVSIPLSILAAVLVLVSLGAGIDGMTLGGLAIAVGEVVDDAIVDVENVWRRLSLNARSASPRPSAEVVRDASREIRGSVVYATAIVALVLVPVMLMGGVAGNIFAPLAHAYVLAICASLLVALTVTPALASWLLPPIAGAAEERSALSRALLDRYRRLLGRLIEHPRAVLVSAAVLALGAAAIVPFLGGRFLPEFHEGVLIANFIAAPGTSLDEMMRLVRRVDAELRPSLVEHLAARAGRGELDEDGFPVHRVEADLLAAPGDSRGVDEAISAAEEKVARVPGLAFTVEDFLGERVHDILAGDTAPIVVKVTGAELPMLRLLAGDVAREMNATPGLEAVRVEPQIDVRELVVRPRAEALGRVGLSPAALIDSVVGWRQGESIAQVLGAEGSAIDIAIAGPVALRSREALRDLPIPTRAGPIALSSLAAIDELPAPVVIGHEGGRRRIGVTAEARGGALSSSVARLRPKLEALSLPAGYRVEIAGEAVARRDAARRLGLFGAILAAAIFALLVSAFGTARDAIIVLANIPLGLVGGVAGALLTPGGLSVAGFVGFVTLFGIIARNGIMLVSHRRHLETEAPELDDVARTLRAAEERLIPILMTAATAGLGLLPLALSARSAGSELEAPMALIVCGGLISSTALNLVVIPTAYVWLSRRKARA